MLRQAIARNAPPMGGRKPARLYYATLVSAAPPTVLIFVNDPDLFPTNYRRYLESCFRKSFDLRSGPLRVRLRRRSQAGDEGAGISSPSR